MYARMSTTLLKAAQNLIGLKAAVLDDERDQQQIAETRRGPTKRRHPHRSIQQFDWRGVLADDADEIRNLAAYGGRGKRNE